jgi:hypothetical protein
MELHHTLKIYRANDIDVVQNEWFVRIDRVLQEEISGLFQAAARIE